MSTDHVVIDRRLARNVESIRVQRGIPRARLMEALGLSRATYYNRRSGQAPWHAAEIHAAAEVLGIGIATLYAEDPFSVLPHRDSNTEPAGYPMSTRNRGGYRISRGRLADDHRTGRGVAA